MYKCEEIIQNCKLTPILGYGYLDVQWYSEHKIIGFPSENVVPTTLRRLDAFPIYIRLLSSANMHLKFPINVPEIEASKLNKLLTEYLKAYIIIDSLLLCVSFTPRYIYVFNWSRSVYDYKNIFKEYDYKQFNGCIVEDTCRDGVGLFRRLCKTIYEDDYNYLGKKYELK